MNNDEPIDGPECMYDLRRLAHLAVKWVVTSSFDGADRKEHEPIRFSGSQVTITTQPQQHNDNTTTTTTTQQQQHNNTNAPGQLADNGGDVDGRHSWRHDMDEPPCRLHAQRAHYGKNTTNTRTHARTHAGPHRLLGRLRAKILGRSSSTQTGV